MSDNEHTAAALGHSEILRVQHPPTDAIPELDQPLNDGGKVPSFVAAEKTGDILDDHPVRSNALKNSVELVPQSGSLSSQSCAASGNGHVLAGESSTNKVNCFGSCADVSHVVIYCYLRPVASQDALALFVDLALPDALHTRAFEAEVKAADTREQRAEPHSSTSGSHGVAPRR
jgi:hypothetical protein